MHVHVLLNCHELRLSQGEVTRGAAGRAKTMTQSGASVVVATTRLSPCFL